MKKELFVFCLLLSLKAFSMEQELHTKEERKKLAQALCESNLLEVKNIVKRASLDVNRVQFYDVISPLALGNDFFDVRIEVPGLTADISLSVLTPLKYAVLTDNLELVSLLCSLGADPNKGNLLYSVEQYSRYRVLPLLLRYGLQLPKNLEGQNILHRGVRSRNSPDTQKFIAASIFLLGKELLDEKDFANQTPLEHARSHSYVRSCLEAIKILGNKELLEKTKQEVIEEFALDRLQEIKKTVGVSAHIYLQGRQLGMNFAEIKQMQAFKKRQQQARIASGKEEE